MADTDGKPRRRAAVKLAELVGRVIDPVTRRRGFATTDLIAAWPEIVGARFAACSRPQKIVWPKGDHMEGAPALLVLRVDGPRAIFVQHEAGQIVERVNAFLGYGAVGHIRIVQAPIGDGPAPKAEPAPLAAESEARLQDAIAGVGDDGLKAALDRLGRAVFSEAERPARRR